MIDNFDEFERIYEEMYDLKFKALFSHSWDEYQMELARKWIKEMRDGE